MTGFELRTSGIGSDRATNWATTTALRNSFIKPVIWKDSWIAKRPKQPSWCRLVENTYHKDSFTEQPVSCLTGLDLTKQ